MSSRFPPTPPSTPSSDAHSACENPFKNCYSSSSSPAASGRAGVASRRSSPAAAAAHPRPGSLGDARSHTIKEEGESEGELAIGSTGGRPHSLVVTCDSGESLKGECDDRTPRPSAAGCGAGPLVVGEGRMSFADAFSELLDDGGSARADVTQAAGIGHAFSASASSSPSSAAASSDLDSRSKPFAHMFFVKHRNKILTAQLKDARESAERDRARSANETAGGTIGGLPAANKDTATRDTRELRNSLSVLSLCAICLVVSAHNCLELMREENEALKER